MEDVIAMPDDRHSAVQLLLPWYAAGTLDEADRAGVDSHLADCARCRLDLAQERRLIVALAVPAPVPAEEDGWHALMERIDRQGSEPAVGALPLTPTAPTRHRRRARWTGAGRVFSDPRRLQWIAGAQFAALLVVAGIAAIPAERPGAYRALGDGAAARTGNVLAMFRPDTSEAALRQALTGVGARMVDGPTGAGAYVLQVPGGENGRPLARLRADPHVTMAEPIAEAPAE